MRKKFLSLLCVVLVPASATAADWYVDAVNGNNANSGTSPSSAFQTIGAAALTALANDRIFVLPGTYSLTTNGEAFPIQFGATLAQQNLQIVGVGGASVTIIDGQGAASAGGLVRFRLMAQGSRFSGFTLRGYGGTLAVIRLGSTSAGFETHDIEIESCVIENSTAWGIGTFGPSGALGSLKIHDNLIVNCATDGMWLSSLDGTGAGDIYNNTIVGCNNGMRLQGGTWNLYNNNVTGNTSCGVFDFCDPTATSCASDAGTGGCPLTFTVVNDFNNVFGSGVVNYQGITPGASAVSVDPLYVNAPGGDYHLTAASPLVEAGTGALPGYVSADGDYDPRALDGDGNGTAVPDIGYDEVTNVGLTMAGTFGLGQVATYTVNGPAGNLGVLTFSVGETNLLLQPLGNLLIDIFPPNGLPLFFVGAVPLAVNIAIPNDPSFSPLALFSQGAAVSFGPFLGKLTNRRLDVL